MLTTASKIYVGRRLASHDRNKGTVNDNDPRGGHMDAGERGHDQYDDDDDDREMNASGNQLQESMGKDQAEMTALGGMVSGQSMQNESVMMNMNDPYMNLMMQPMDASNLGFMGQSSVQPAYASYYDGYWNRVNNYNASIGRFESDLANWTAINYVEDPNEYTYGKQVGYVDAGPMGTTLGNAGYGYSSGSYLTKGDVDSSYDYSTSNDAYNSYYGF